MAGSSKPSKGVSVYFGGALGSRVAPGGIGAPAAGVEAAGVLTGAGPAGVPAGVSAGGTLTGASPSGLTIHGGQ